MGGVKGKYRVCGSSTCVLFALRVCGFTGGVKGKPRVRGSSTCVLFALRICDFKGGVYRYSCVLCVSLELLPLAAELVKFGVLLMVCVKYC
jgi:hypothetical protein